MKISIQNDTVAADLILKTNWPRIMVILLLTASANLGFAQTLAVAQPRTERQLIDVLKSNAGLQEKDAACVELKRIGTARSVPALAELLADEELSHSARYALESMPVPEAGLALIEALDKTSGLTKAGIMHSLGQRRERRATASISKLLADPDPSVVRAAAAALGRIGGVPTTEQLFAALGEEREAEQRNAILDALLAAANKELEDGELDSASAVFEKLAKIPTPNHVRAAAYRSRIAAADPDGALELVKTAVQSDDQATQLVSLQMAPLTSSPQTTAVLGDLLAEAPSSTQVALIEALRQRGDPTAAPALVAMVKSPDPAVRAAALGALGELGDATTLAVLLEAAALADETEKKAARQALLVLRRGDVAKALIEHLKAGSASIRAEAVRALAGRGEKEAVDNLIFAAEKGSDSARKAAFLALGQLADQTHVSSLVKLVVEAKDETSRSPACAALNAACLRLQSLGIPVDGEPIASALGGADTPTRVALLRATSALTDDRIRAALRSALSDSDQRLREAAALALCETRDPELLPDLLLLAEQAPDLNQRVQAVRGLARLTSESDPVRLRAGERVDALRQVLPLARPEEKWLMLAGLAKLDAPEALELALCMIDDPAAHAEAVQAVTKIASVLAETHHELARSALQRVLSVASEPDQREAAEKVLAEINALAGPGSAVAFRRLKIDGKFRSEGIAVADFNADGQLDIATGNILYLGPDWKSQPMLGSPKEYRPEGYSEEFLCFAEDIDGDKWTDLIVVGFPGAKTRWLRNPGRSGDLWKEFLAIEKTGNESPDWVDVDRDGRRELVLVSDGGMALARPAADPAKLWPIRVIAGPEDPRPAHGLGVGDINGDGRSDVLCAEGWWESPADPADVPWAFHKAKLGFEAPAQMLAFDADGDGDSDVVSSGAHRYGLWWYEQTAAGWTAHEIDCTISQLHALHSVDLNRDGLPDLVTGKRFWAHREGDEGIDDPAVVCWFELRRDAGRPSWLRHEIDSDSGVGLHFQIADLNGDGRLDIVTSNKKGVYVFMQNQAAVR